MTTVGDFVQPRWWWLNNVRSNGHLYWSLLVIYYNTCWRNLHIIRSHGSKDSCCRFLKPNLSKVSPIYNEHNTKKFTFCLYFLSNHKWNYLLSLIKKNIGGMGLASPSFVWTTWHLVCFISLFTIESDRLGRGWRQCIFVILNQITLHAQTKTGRDTCPCVCVCLWVCASVQYYICLW